MQDVEAEYDRYWQAAGGKARVRRSLSLYGAFWEMLAFQIRKRNPELSEREVKIRVARRMYLSDPATQELIDQMEKSTWTKESGTASGTSTQSSAN